MKFDLKQMQARADQFLQREIQLFSYTQSNSFGEKAENLNLSVFFNIEESLFKVKDNNEVVFEHSELKDIHAYLVDNYSKL